MILSILRRWRSDFYSYNASRYHLAQFVQRAAHSVDKSSIVLDAGAGEGMYRSFFDHTHYESTDFYQVTKPYGDVSFVSNLAYIPISDKRYDMILLTQVIEHLPDPLRVLQELYRLLKDHGQLWLSGPLFFPEHEQPYDFYRYTQFGLRYLVEHAGFEVLDLQPLEGYGTTVSFQLKSATRELPLNSSAYGGGIVGITIVVLLSLSKPLFHTLAMLLDYADRKHKITDVGMCKNYCLVAVKR